MNSIIPPGPIDHLFDAMAALRQFAQVRDRAFRSLTEREVEVLTLVAEGRTNPNIARQLGIARATVQNHRASIRQKLNISSEADYVMFALAYELIQL